MEDKREVLESIRKELKELEDQPVHAPYGVGLVNGDYVVYTVSAVRLFLKEALAYYEEGNIKEALVIWRFVDSLYSVGADYDS